MSLIEEQDFNLTSSDEDDVRLPPMKKKNFKILYVSTLIHRLWLNEKQPLLEIIIQKSRHELPLMYCQL